MNAPTPAWLLRDEVALCPCGCIGTRNKIGFVDKTINGASTVLRQVLFTDETASRPGVLQRIDPRVKVITTLAFVVSAAVVRNITVLVGMYAVAVAVAAVSRISIPYFIKRVWLFVPIFTAVVVMPATLSVITPGRVVLPLGTWFGHRVGVTAQGLRSASLVVVRVATSISFVALLTITTRWSRLLAALRAIRLPRMFVLVLGMAYRYVFHLLSCVTDMYEARKARTVDVRTGTMSGRVFVSTTGGALFAKAHTMSEEVHQAMTARGYTGDQRTMSSSRIRAIDFVWFLTCAALITIAVLVDRAIGR
ncbi:MAG TPA: cobalt ECF transporter T component CbiQ [Ilumatobacteraceae bacterium]